MRFRLDDDDRDDDDDDKDVHSRRKRKMEISNDYTIYTDKRGRGYGLWVGLESS